MNTTVNKSNKKKVKSNFSASNKAKDFSKDPFFQKKAKEAERFLKKFGLPKM
jgi:hypothetical protein